MLRMTQVERRLMDRLYARMRRSRDSLACYDAPGELDLVQVRNPKTGRYVVIDRERGVLVKQKRTPGPYRGISEVGPERAKAVWE